MSQLCDSLSPEPEPKELSALDYARQNGIARNYLKDVTTSFESICDLVRNNVETVAFDNSNLPIFSFGSEFRLEERMTFTQDAAKLLSSIARLETVESINATTSMLLDCRQRRKFKLELPMLNSDHELDCKEFSRRDNFEIQLKNVKLPLELVDVERGEGLGWPRSLKMYGPTLIQKMKKEKIQVKRDTVDFIRIASCIQWTVQDQNELWATEGTYKKTKIKEPITPTILPLDKSLVPYEPSPGNEAFEMPILSDSPDLLELDRAKVEEELFKHDVPAGIRHMRHGEGNSSDTYSGDGTVSMKDIYSPLASWDKDLPPLLERKRFKPEDYKVETPLTPQLPTVSPNRVVRFSGLVMELDYDAGSPSTNPDGLQSRFFEDGLHAHEKITRQSEQEKLVYADAMSRVDILEMDFRLPDPPWKLLYDAKSSTGLLEVQKKVIKTVIKGCGKKVGWWAFENEKSSLLKWNIPRHHAEAAVRLEFPNDHKSWQQFVGDVKNDKVIDSSAIVWKPEGLRILKDDDDDNDDEIEVAKFLKMPPAEMSSLIKKRRMEVPKETDTNPRTTLRLKTDAGPSHQPLSKKPRLESGSKSIEGSFGTLLGTRFSARNSVDNYMEIKGTKKPQLSGNSFFARKPNGLPDRKIGPSPQQLHSTFPIRKSPLPKPVTIPVPKFDIPSTPFHIVMSTAMYKKKDLIRTIERTLSSVTLIERDFTAQNATCWLPGSVNRSPIVSPLSTEADFIVSPSLGIIITTTQKIKQKPLPGSKTKSEIRDRVESVSLRYDSLLILVSEDNQSETANGMDSYDCQALADFMGFKSGLKCNVVVQFVPGGDLILSQWLMYAMVQHRSTEELLVEQTHWELFLRRAGMNAFAAQIILSRMKAPEGVDGSSPVKAGLFGVTGFVEMSKHERLVRFEELCGRRLMERVSDVIDAGW